MTRSIFVAAVFLGCLALTLAFPEDVEQSDTELNSFPETIYRIIRSPKNHIDRWDLDDNIPTHRPPYRPYPERPRPTPFDKPFTGPRFRRSPFGEGERNPAIAGANQNNQRGWEVNPNLSRDDRGNTVGRLGIKNHGEHGDFEASWGQNLRGPDKHSEVWSVGGTWRF